MCKTCKVTFVNYNTFIGQDSKGTTMVDDLKSCEDYSLHSLELQARVLTCLECETLMLLACNYLPPARMKILSVSGSVFNAASKQYKLML